jgi:hypothetical protein
MHQTVTSLESIMTRKSSSSGNIADPTMMDKIDALFESGVR